MVIYQEILAQVIAIRIIQDISGVGVSAFRRSSLSALLTEESLSWHLFLDRMREPLLDLTARFRAVGDTAIITAVRLPKLRIDLFELNSLGLFLITFNLVDFINYCSFSLFEWVLINHTLVGLLVSVIIT